MKVLYVTSEANPFAASGGLGDVMGALPGAISDEGVKAEVILPLYSNIKDEYREKFESNLLEEFSAYCDLEKIKVEFMEETKRAVYGAAMIAIQGAIDSIEV